MNGPPPDQTPQRGKGLAMALAGLVVFGLLGAGAVAAYRLNGDDGPPPTRDPSTRAAAPPPSEAVPPASTPQPPVDPDSLRPGDCFVNLGTSADPNLRRIGCTTNGALEVVAKIAFTTDEKRCAEPGIGAGPGRYDDSLVMDRSPGAQGDYVLCLKHR